METGDTQSNLAKRLLSRRFQVSLVFEGGLVGAVCGVVITLYRLSLSGAEQLLRTVTGAAAGSAALMAAWAAALAVILVAVASLVRWEPATSGSGIPQVDAEVMDKLDMPWHRVLAAKFAEGSLLALAGLSMGREGPSVQLGGVSGKAVSRALRRSRGEERLLVTCGAAAGMSAAFHAPLTGVLFALEEIHREFSAPLIISVMCSSVTADFVMSQVLGLSPVLSIAIEGALPHISYAVVILLGVLCGLAGTLHNRGMFALNGVFGRIGGAQPFTRYVAPFALAWVAAFFWPDLMCGGDAIVEKLLEPGGMTLGVIVALLIGKYVFTAVCFGAGAPGGTLFPLVVMGGLLGTAYGLLVCEPMGLGETYLANFAALGVAGLFSGVVRAPVTAVVLVFELTGSLDALLSVSIVSIAAYVTANLLRVDPFYEHLLIGLLAKGGEMPQGASGTKVLRSVHVGSGSRIEGRLVSEVPWPDDARVVTIERAGTELVPTGDTRILGLDELLVIVGANMADDALLKLGLMCEQRVRK